MDKLEGDGRDIFITFTNRIAAARALAYRKYEPILSHPALPFHGRHGISAPMVEFSA